MHLSSRLRPLTVLLLLTACSSSPSATAVSSTPSTTATTTATTTPAATAPRVAASATPTPPPTAARVEPVGTAVPAGFTPTSATFISAGTGWVLGQAPCKQGTCDALVRTHDGGRTWRAVPAPATTPDHLVGLRFADPRNGFVYGDGLWVTHDGAGSWVKVAGLPQAGPLEAAQGRVWFQAKGKGLRSGPVTGNTYPVARTDTDGTSVVVHGSTVLATTTAGGHGRPQLLVGQSSHFVLRPTPCVAGEQPIVGARTATDLLLVCDGGAGAGQQQKQAYTSADGGMHWTQVADPPPVPGTSISLPPHAAFIMDSRAVEVSRDGGRTWARSLSADGIGEGGFESATLGYAIGDFGSGTVMDLTHDTGRTWTTVRFS
ncbi:MAG: glycosyl hydrolase, repeat-containing protein [Frankiales bacterium]|nr:glycosyl hydrolase, repeat-containing protein [Frankiales bacterium]